MGRIVSSVGLVTGTNINDTVDQLIAIQARPRDLVVNRNKTIEDQRTALTGLTAQLVAVQLTVRKFSNANLYSQRSTSSSDSTLLDVSASGTPALGNYQYVPVRTATAQQLQSSQFTSATAALGAGTLRFRNGGFLDTGASLDTLNSGAGFTRGKIRITDRSGATADLDLSTARSIDDVLNAINTNTSIKVKASTVNGAIRLTDLTGSTSSNLRVDELAGGTTASSLGLSGVNVASNSATGSTVGTLFADLALSQLNDRRGFRFDNALPDLRVQLRDGTRAVIDFKKLATNGNKAAGTTTASNGVNAQFTLTAKSVGPTYGDVTINLVDDAGITAGDETVTYDSNAKTLTVRIDQGNTTANQVIEAINSDTTVSPLFSASRATNSDGTGLVTAADTGITKGPKATATTVGTDSPNAKLRFTAKNGGSDYDDVKIEFIDDAGITGGNETVTFDQSDPNNKKLTFRIDQGNTTANDIVDALTNDVTASQYFSVENITGSTGTGKVVAADSLYTTGGALTAATTATDELTLRDVLNVINTASPGKLTASIVNNRLQLVDTSTDNGHTFGVEQLFNSKVATDLGLDVSASGGTITGKRIYAGLKTSLLSTLDGGKGLGTLGNLSITDRSGATATVDLSSAETVDDVLTAINNAGLGVTASYNSARTGIALTDTTGSTTSNLIIANGDVTNTADKLGIAVNAATTSKQGNDLKQQLVSEATLLSALNGGAGVANGNFNITDNNGVTKSLTIGSSTKTVGDVITAIDNLGLAIEARINAEGDGILLVDTTNGSGSTLGVREGNSRTARDLGLLKSFTTETVDSVSRKVIKGSVTSSIEIGATESLNDLVSKINSANAGVRATIINDGSSVKPFKLTLFNQNAGSAAELLVDTSATNFTFNETIRGQDALIQLGGPGGALIASSSNTFSNLLPEARITIKGTSTSPVTVNVTESNAGIVTTVKELVDTYNKVRDRITTLSAFNTDTNRGALLQGDNTLQRIENDLANIVTKRNFGAGSIQSLAELGVSISDQGKLALDETKLNAVLAQRPADVQEFLFKKETGFAAKFDKLLEQQAGVGNSVLISRIQALTRRFDTNTQRIEFFNARLERSRERLLLSYQRIEIAISKLQQNQSALNSLAALANGQNQSN